MRVKKIILRAAIILAVLVGFAGKVFLPHTAARQSQDAVESHEPVAVDADLHHAEAEPLDAGKLIISHVLDAHEWHFMTLPSGKEVAMYLPMILIHEGKFYCFSSKHLYHSDTHSYKGFEIDDNEHVVRRHADGTLYESKVWDFSITKTVVGIFLGCLTVFLIFFFMAKAYAKNRMKAPKGFWNLFEIAIIFVRDTIAIPSLGEKKYEKYMPFLLTAFFFILINNVMGQIPNWPNVTGNIAITLTLALFTFFITAFSGNKHYWKEIFNPDVPMWMKFPIPLMPFIEFVGTLTKPFALTMRLFANITAGHIVMMAFVCLIFLLGANSIALGYGSSVLSVFLSLFMYVLELLVAFIQAFIFTLLSALYIGLAIEDPHKEAH